MYTCNVTIVILVLTTSRAAEKFSSTTSSYKVDLGKQEAAGKGLGLTAADTPAVVIFKDGKNVKTLKGINADTGSEIAATLAA
jgi:hypothetical protein